MPPLLDLPVAPTMHPFAKEAFPDFLWLLTMLRLHPRGAGPVTLALDAGQAAFHRAFKRGSLDGDQEPVFHGALTDWERMPDTERDEILTEFSQSGIYDAVAPEVLAHVLAAYDDAPGRWLIQPRLDAGLEPILVKAEEHLWETMRLGGDSHLPLATDAIYLWLRGMVKMRRISFHQDDPGFKALKRYEGDIGDGERRLAQATLRSLFLALRAAEAERDVESVEWCRRFTRANGQLFKCVTAPQTTPEPVDEAAVASGSARIYRMHLRFLHANEAVQVDVWDHDRQDVITGITWRALRVAAHLIAHPAMWSEEHGYGSIRMLFEAYVHLTWMLHIEGERPGIWADFKNYGRGRNKMLLLHTEAQIERHEGEPREILERLLPKMKADSNRDTNEAFQDISTAGTFADDRSLFAMAQEVGLDAMYQSVMIPSSSTLHGDWSALDDLILERCVHALHDRHVMPRIAYAEESDERLPFLAERFANWTFDLFCEVSAIKPLSDEELDELTASAT